MSTPASVRAPLSGAASQPLTRALAILDVLADSPEGASLEDVAAVTEIPRSTTHRLIRSLESERMVMWDPVRAVFFVGPRCIRYAGNAQAHLLAGWMPALNRLAAAAHEVVDVSVLVDDSVVVAHQISTTHRLRAVAQTGDRLPSHATANGKALLSLLGSDDIRARLPEELAAFTSHTVTERRVLLAQLAEVSARDHVAIEYEENTVGVSGVAAAFFSPLGIPTAVGVPVPAARFEGKEEHLSQALIVCRDEITATWQ